MPTDSDKGLQEFIAWKGEYDSRIRLIDLQHQGILRFLNAWYQEVKAGMVCADNLLECIREKYRYLEFYSRAHLAFEEKMMELMAASHGFPEEERQSHVAIHQRFTKDFMEVIAGQVEMLAHERQKGFMDSIAADGLKDVARWWYSHIRTAAAGVPAGPDHAYRAHLQRMSAEAKLSLLNELILFFEESTVNAPAA